MPYVIRSAIAAGGTLVAMAVATFAMAAAPPGPRVAFVDWNGRARTFELVTVDAGGHDMRRVAGGRFSAKVIDQAPFGYRTANGKGIMPVPDAPSWSSDGGRVLFSAWLVKTGKRWRFKWPGRSFIAMADGSDLRMLQGLRDAAYPMLLPDGHTVVFARARRSPAHPHAALGEYSLWVGRLNGSERRRLTPWRSSAVDYPSSASPDGLTVAVSRVDERKAQLNPKVSAVAIPLDGGSPRVLARDAGNPVYSPDGTRIAFTRITDEGSSGQAGGALYVAAADGSSPMQLTPGKEAADTSPSWDPSGRRIVFARTDYSGHNAPKLSIEQINADGTCEGALFRDPGSFLLAVPVWQPGLGREAGPISC
jgi:Tol biopolymer transport system component